MEVEANCLVQLLNPDEKRNDVVQDKQQVFMTKCCTMLGDKLTVREAPNVDTVDEDNNDSPSFVT